MRKFWFLPLICGLLLSGCIRVSLLQDLAVVQGAAVDYADGQYVLTLQLFSTGSSGQAVDPSAQNAQTITCSGKTVADALSQTSLSQGRSFFLGHDRLLILGEGTRGQDLAGLLGELESLSLREDVIVLAAEGEASSILNMQVDQGILPAMTIEQTVTNASREGRMTEMRLLELKRSLAENHRSAVVPVISADETDGLQTFLLSGAAVYSGGKYQGQLEGDALAGVLFFEDHVETMPLTVDGRSLKIYHCDSKLIPQLSEKTEFILCIKGRAMTRGPVQMSDAELKKTEELLEERVRLCCEAAFEEGVENYRCDILGMGDVLWRQQPALFRTLQGNWPESAEITVRYEVDMVIDSFPEG